MTNFVLYIVAVYAPPEPTLTSLNVVSCKSKVVPPESNLLSLLLDRFSAPITSLVPSSFMSNVEPNLQLISVSGALIVCCRVYVFVDPSAFHL